MNCEEIEELAGAYALGALPDEESIAVSAHLESCDKHPEMYGLQVAAASLALAAPAIDPPPALKSRLMDAIRAGSPPQRAPVSAAPRRSFGDAVRGWLSNPRLGYGLASAMAVLVIGLVAWNVSLQGGDATTVTPINGNAAGRMIYLPGEKLAVLDVQSLTPPPPDMVYEIWSMSGGVAVPIGFLDVTPSGDSIALIQLDASDVDQLAVTLEPAPGMGQPTSAPVFTAQFS